MTLHVKPIFVLFVTTSSERLMSLFRKPHPLSEFYVNRANRASIRVVIFTYFSHWFMKFTLYTFSSRFIAELWSKMFSAIPFARQLFTSLSDALSGRNEVSEFVFSLGVLRHTFVFSALSQILALAIVARGQVQIWNNLCQELCKVLAMREG